MKGEGSCVRKVLGELKCLDRSEVLWPSSLSVFFVHAQRRSRRHRVGGILSGKGWRGVFAFSVQVGGDTPMADGEVENGFTFNFSWAKEWKYTPTISHTVGRSKTRYGGKAVDLRGLGTLTSFIPLDFHIPFLAFILKAWFLKMGVNVPKIWTGVPLQSCFF